MPVLHHVPEEERQGRRRLQQMDGGRNTRLQVKVTALFRAGVAIHHILRLVPGADSHTLFRVPPVRRDKAHDRAGAPTPPLPPQPRTRAHVRGFCACLATAEFDTS